MTGSPGIENIIRKGRKAVQAGAANRLESLKVEYLPVDAVRPNDYNPNRQSDRDFALLLRSMSEDGFTQPIIAQRSSRMIVDGEHRWRAARELGLPEIPIVFVDMTDEQMRVATLRHNRARGSEDVDLSAQVLRDLRELGALDWAQDSLLINDRELDKMLEDVDAAQTLAGDDWNEAWTPTRVNNTTQERDGKNGRTSATEATVKVHQAAVERLQAAKTDAERIVIERDARKGNYRVVLNFQEADADLVKAVLEPNPAQRLLEICREEIAAGRA